jgi:hypothetical protein
VTFAVLDCSDLFEVSSGSEGEATFGSVAVSVGLESRSVESEVVLGSDSGEVLISSLGGGLLF